VKEVIVPPMRFKEYVFPNNPESCTLVCERSVGRHKYPNRPGEEMEDLDPDAMILSGNGEFIGVDAYEQWLKLFGVYESKGPGLMVHPIFPLKEMVFKKLETKVEPRPNYVAFSFEFWEHRPVRRVITKVTQGIPTSISSTTSQSVKTHKFKKGETLWGLAGRYYGDHTKATLLQTHNKIRDPRAIPVGLVVEIP
jgi:nucleoid-associated protein YgaU